MPVIGLNISKMFRLKVILIHILTVLFLGACSTSPPSEDGADERLSDLDYRGSDCILIRTVRDYTPLDNQHLLIRGPGRRAYFVTLIRPAFEMRGSMGLRFESRDDQLCPYGGDAIIFGGISNERVTVQAISRLTADQEEQLLIRYGKKTPPDAETPADVKGAEVEELG